MQTAYYAHSTNNSNKSDWQSLKGHLSATGKIASENASKFGAGEHGLVAGLLHDLGKYSQEFQLRIEGKHGRVSGK